MRTLRRFFLQTAENVRAGLSPVEARRQAVLKSVALALRGAFGRIIFGLLLGLPLSFAAGRFLGAQLYGMNPYKRCVPSNADVPAA